MLCCLCSDIFIWCEIITKNLLDNKVTNTCPSFTIYTATRYVSTLYLIVKVKGIVLDIFLLVYVHYKNFSGPLVGDGILVT